jgi:hypothetical protein
MLSEKHNETSDGCQRSKIRDIKDRLLHVFLSLLYKTLPEYLTKKGEQREHVSLRVLSPKVSCTKLDVCGLLTPTVIYPNEHYQNLCIGRLACSYEILNHLSCQNSKNDNLSVCVRKSQLQLAVLLTLTFLLWFYSTKKKRTSTLWVFPGPQKVSKNRYDALLLFTFRKMNESKLCDPSARSKTMGHGAYDEESYENIMPLSILCFRNRTVAINRTLVGILASFLHYILPAGFQKRLQGHECALCSSIQKYLNR